MYGVDLFELTQDRSLQTPEIHTQNDFYGNAAILKRYAGIPIDYALKSVVEHVPQYPGMQWHVEMEASLPGFMASSKKSLSYIYKNSGKLPLAIGPHIAYAQNILSDQEKNNLKAKLGKNLLVYLPHSSHHTHIVYDEIYTLKKIKEIAKNFNSVSVCIYWKDINSEKLSKYKSCGYYVVSCGHMFDVKFMDRQLTLLQLSECVLSFGYVSALIYAAYLNKMICIQKITDYKKFSDIVDTIAINKFSLSCKKKEIYWQKYLEELCSIPSYLPPSLLELFSFVGGFDQVKTSEELRNFLNLTENIFFLSHILKLKNFPDPVTLLTLFDKMGMSRQVDTLKNVLKAISINP